MKTISMVSDYLHGLKKPLIPGKRLLDIYNIGLFFFS